MRSLPWLFRVILFAAGFGVGLSQHKLPPKPTIVLELHLTRPEVRTSTCRSSSPATTCSPAFVKQILAVQN